MQQHFVTFFSPGTFFSECDDRPIKSWHVPTAVRMARKVKQRYGATPYGFQFSTRARGKKDLDSKTVKMSAMYYLGGKVETYEEVMRRTNPDEHTLRSNMRINGYKRIIVNTNSYKITLPLKDDDVVLDFKP